MLRRPRVDARQLQDDLFFCFVLKPNRGEDCRAGRVFYRVTTSNVFRGPRSSLPERKKENKKKTKKKQIQTERQREAAVKILKIKEERKQTENAV